MKRTRNKLKIMGLLLTMVLLIAALGFFSITASATEVTIIAQGDCSADGSSVQWTLDDSGILTVTGTGEMARYGAGTSPWYDYRDSITSIVIKEGVTSIGRSAFYNCVKMTDVEIPTGVTYIGIEAFANCDGLEIVTIPGSVSTIDNNAFYGCDELTTVKIANGVVSIGQSAFCNSGKLKSIELPESVTSIGPSAFSGCSSLEQFKIPQGVTTIQSSTFNKCTSLVTIEIPDSVTSIGSSAFLKCSALESIRIPQGVTEIGGITFYQCTSLTSIKLPDSVTIIGDSAFWGCTALQSINIPNKVTSINVAALGGCESLTEIEIPHSVTHIGKNAFNGNINMSKVTVSCAPQFSYDFGDGVTLVYNDHSYTDCICTVCKDAYSHLGDHSKIVPTEDGRHTATWSCCGVVMVEDHNPDKESYRDLENGTHSFTCTDCGTVTEAHHWEQGACTLCGATCSHSLVENVCTVCGIATGFCGAAENEGGVESIRWTYEDGTLIFDGDGAMAEYNLSRPWGAYGDRVTTIVIGEGITTIADFAFQSFTALESIEIPKGVVKIGAQAFDGCSALKSVEIPDSVTLLGANAFHACTVLESIKLSNGLDMISKGVFESCKALMSIEIPNKVDVISNRAFYNCINLTNVKISHSVYAISETAFEGCTNLTTVITSCDPQFDYAFGDGVTIKQEHPYENGTCTVCGDVCSHTGGTANCGSPAVCENCGEGYGEVDKANHDETVTYENGFCPHCDAYQPAELNESGYYEIANAGQLYWFADRVNNDNANYKKANAILVADIDLNPGYVFGLDSSNALTVTKNGETVSDLSVLRAWTPIGSGEVIDACIISYQGIFDGNGKTVRGAYINNAEQDYVGLFGRSESGTIKNLHIDNFYLHGGSQVGGVIAVIIGNARVENCSANGITVGNGEIGGIVGYISNILIVNCHYVGTVIGVSDTSVVGGICGTNMNAIVVNCYSACKIFGGSDSVGGVIGWNSEGMVFNCYFDSDTFGGNAVGYSEDSTEKNTEGKSHSEFTLGEVAYLLSLGCKETVQICTDTEAGIWEDVEMVFPGTVWGQHLGENGDAYPVLGGEKVYYGYVSCADDAVKVYTNNAIASAEKLGHIGGTATCTKQAECERCGASYGNMDDNAHSPLAEWIAGENGHWHDCEACGADLDFGSHNYETEWRYDEEWHWHECAQCGYNQDMVHHESGEATCTEKAVCESCGASYGNIDENAHTNYDTAWETDANEHWNKCACGDKVNKAAHTDSNNDGKCDTCEYQMVNGGDNTQAPDNTNDPNNTTDSPDDVPDNPNNTTDSPDDAPDNPNNTTDSPDDAPDNPNNTTDNPADDPINDPIKDTDGLGTGAIVGIAVGSAAVVGIGGFALLWFVIKKKSLADLIAIFKR